MKPKTFTDPVMQMEWNLSHHAPTTESQTEAMSTLRREAIRFGHSILRNTPAGRERAQALTALEDSLQYAIASIARADVTDDA